MFIYRTSLFCFVVFSDKWVFDRKLPSLLPSNVEKVCFPLMKLFLYTQVSNCEPYDYQVKRDDLK